MRTTSSSAHSHATIETSRGHHMSISDSNLTVNFFKTTTVYNKLESAKLKWLDISLRLESAEWKIQSTFQLQKKKNGCTSERAALNAEIKDWQAQRAQVTDDNEKAAFTALIAKNAAELMK